MGTTGQQGARGPNFQRHRVSWGIIFQFRSYPHFIIIVLQFLPPDLGKAHPEPTRLGSNDRLCSLICLEETLYLLYSFPSPMPRCLLRASCVPVTEDAAMNEIDKNAQLHDSSILTSRQSSQAKAISHVNVAYYKWKSPMKPKKKQRKRIVSAGVGQGFFVNKMFRESMTHRWHWSLNSKEMREGALWLPGARGVRGGDRSAEVLNHSWRPKTGREAWVAEAG